MGSPAREPRLAGAGSAPHGPRFPRVCACDPSEAPRPRRTGLGDGCPASSQSGRAGRWTGAARRQGRSPARGSGVFGAQAPRAPGQGSRRAEAPLREKPWAAGAARAAHAGSEAARPLWRAACLSASGHLESPTQLLLLRLFRGHLKMFLPSVVSKPGLTIVCRPYLLFLFCWMYQGNVS